MKLFRFMPKPGDPSLCCSGVDRGDTVDAGGFVILTEAAAKVIAKSMGEALIPITGADAKTVCRACDVRSLKEMSELPHAKMQAMCRKVAREAEAEYRAEAEEARKAEEARIVAAVNAAREETTTEATEAQPSE